MKLVERLINGILLACAVGRIPKPGKLFRVGPFASDVLALHDFPNNGNSPYNCIRLRVDKHDNASLLILKVQEDVPLWDQWIQVLYCRKNNLSTEEETIVGWVTYLEFNRLVLVEWDRWEEEKSGS